MTQQAKTRLIEYVPYAHRNERLAIGVLVMFNDGRVRAHLATNLRKVSAVDPACNLDALREGLDHVARELTAQPDLIDLHVSGIGPLRVAPNEGFITFDSPADYDRGIRWALDLAAEPAPARIIRDRAPVSRLFLEMKSAFSACDWLAKPGQGIEDHRIVPRYALSPDDGLTVDFALKNGALNCVQTSDFRATSHVAQRRVEAQAKVLALGLAPQLTGQIKTRSIFVVAGSHQADAKRSMRLAERVADRLFVQESAQDMQALMDLLAAAMGQPPLPQLATD